MKQSAWKIIIALAFFLFFLFHLNQFIFLTKSIYSDIPITHYPNLLYIKRTILEYLQIPLWSNLIFSGTPFAANPLSGLWYMPGWLALLFPLPLGINISLFLHLLFGVWGMYLFLHLRGRSEMGSLFGALSFFAGVKIIAHVGAGHLTLVYALSWTPWLIFFTEVSAKRQNWTRFVWPGFAIGLIISADPRWIIPAGLIWIPYLIYLNKKSNTSIFNTLLTSIKLIFSNICIGLGLSAAVWLPLLEFVRYSSRLNLLAKDNLSYSLEPEKFFGLVFPDFGGFSEWIIYPSLIILFLSILVVFLYRENQGERIWFLIFLIGFFLSLGKTLPFLTFFFELPLVNLLRVPARYFFISLFCLSVVASFGFDYLVKGMYSYKFDRLFFLTPLYGFIVIFFIGVSFLTHQVNLNFVWSFIFAGLVFLIIAMSLHHKLAGNLLVAVLFALLFFDVVGVNTFSLYFRSKEYLVNRSPEIYQILTFDKPYRIYTPSYAISQEEGAYWKISQINGIDPMQLKSYGSFFTAASNIPLQNYSVTLPAFGDGEPGEINKQYCPDAERLEKLSVKFVVSDFSMEKCIGLKLANIHDEKFLYEIEPMWAWDTGTNTKIDLDNREIQFITYSPNLIEFTIQKQGLVTISEINYPGWKVFVNGQKQKIVQNDIFRSFYLPQTENEVRMVFQPVSVFIGLSCEVITWILIIILWKRKRNQPGL